MSGCAVGDGDISLTGSYHRALFAGIRTTSKQLKEHPMAKAPRAKAAARPRQARPTPSWRGPKRRWLRRNGHGGGSGPSGYGEEASASGAGQGPRFRPVRPTRTRWSLRGLHCKKAGEKPFSATRGKLRHGAGSSAGGEGQGQGDGAEGHHRSQARCCQYGGTGQAGRAPREPLSPSSVLRRLRSLRGSRNAVPLLEQRPRRAGCVPSKKALPRSLWLRSRRLRSPQPRSPQPRSS